MYRLSLILLFLLPAFSVAQDRPLPPMDAPKAMTLPPGFSATLFAGEPDVVQPIAFCFDDRGRLWVVECLSYPKWKEDGTGNDRVVIFEDTDGDGKFDKKTVFWDKGSNLSGIEVGFGGVWLCSTPNLIFIPMANDKPAGPPQIVLDGFDLKAKHNVSNSLTWGPDGWLYGCNGILSHAKLGKPGTPDAKRVQIDCGVFRYHPVRKEVEAFAHGTTNPWGLDFDDYGQMFITNCVIHHIWHVVPGAHFQRMFGEDLNPNCYALMPSIADHLHWGGGDWTTSRGGKGVHDAPGGGHAHSGCMVYLGDNWPDEYRNNAFMCNIHGNRVNRDILERRGSTYVAKHGPDFMMANDPWFRGLALKYGPDGGVYVCDWTDTGECHNYEKVDLTNGRIYKVVYGKPKPWHDDLSKRSDVELAKLQLHKNDWMVSHARRILQERAAAGKIDPKAISELRAILDDNPDVTRKLRALWALHVVGELNEAILLDTMKQSSEYLRAWAVELSLEERKPTLAIVQKCEAMAKSDPSPFVRLYIAASLLRFSTPEQIIIASRLLGRAEDAADPYLPLMYWYGIEPTVAVKPEMVFPIIAEAKVGLVQRFLTRRFLSLPGKTRDEVPYLLPLIKTIAKTNDPSIQLDLLSGLQEATAGRLFSAPPAGWKELITGLLSRQSAEIRSRAFDLCVRVNDEDYQTILRQIVTSPDHSPLELRQAALHALLLRPNESLQTILLGLLTEPAMRKTAIRGLAAYKDDKVSEQILDIYLRLDAAEKADAVQTLSSRPTFAMRLLDAIENGLVPRTDISPFVARQMLALKNPQVSEKLAKVWGTIRPASKERAALTVKYKAVLLPDDLKKADPAKGKIVFAKTCASCHKLFGEGGAIGPDLTGGQRTNLDYILENVLDPSAVVAKEYQVVIVELKNGRTLSGIIKSETDRAVTVQTQNEAIVVAKADIETRTQTNVSMMPEGLLEKLTTEEIQNLVAYLMGPTKK